MKIVVLDGATLNPGDLSWSALQALAPDLRNGRIAKTIEEAKALMENSDGRFAGDAVMAAKDRLRGITQGRIGLVGFSMGAGWSLIVASAVPEQRSATVLFYGNEYADYGKITSKVMGHHPSPP